MENDLDELFEEKEPERASTETAKCPSCGANMVYDPETRGLKCPYCGDGKKLAEHDYSEELALQKLFETRADEWKAETKVFRCENCGATTVISRNELSKECPFCGTSNVVEKEEMSGMRPNAVLPFTVTKEQAKISLSQWAKKKIFSPNGFRKSITPEKMKGNYSPAFTFDAHAVGRYHGTLGEYYYVTRTVNGRTEQVRKIRYFPIKGTYENDFDDVLVQAARNISQKTLNKLQPFDTNNSQKYASEYLQGYTATQYERSGEECWKAAKDSMYDTLQRKILAQYHYDVVESFHMDVTYHNVTYKYVLIPLYIGNYTFKKKLYNFFVNGRSGKVDGKAPLSVWKVGSLVLGILAAIAVIVVLYIYYGG